MSRDPEMEVLVEEGDRARGELLLRSPGVGVYGDAPNLGEILVPRSRLGRLFSLGRTTVLVLPRGRSGRVTQRALRNRRDPVEYGQVLLRLAPIEEAQLDQGSVDPARAIVDGLPEGCSAVTSPTHGVFYRRPRPDAPAYVEVGQVVEEGNTLALVEVMKCFSAITYGGEGLPPRAEIVESRVEDSSEVHADQVLFLVKPA